MSRATKERKGNQDYLEAFFDAFAAESNGAIKLASPEAFYNRNLSDEVTLGMTDDQVKVVLKKKVSESIESAYGVLRERIDKFGVVQPNIQKLGESGRILVELPGAKDIDRVEKLLSSTAQLEFWETLKPDEVGNFLVLANDALKKTETKATKASVDTTKAVAKDDKSKINDLITDKASTDKSSTKDLGPIFSKIDTKVASMNPSFNVKDTALINSYLNRADIRALLPAAASNAKFAWGKTNDKNKDVTELYFLKGTSDNVAPLTGGVVTDAMKTFDRFGKPAVSMQMNPTGARKWEQLTGDIAKQGNHGGYRFR